MKHHVHNLVVILCIGVIVGLGMMGTFAAWLRMPQGRTFNGMHGFSDDYTGYVSYIKEGMDGRRWVAIRSLPLPQTPTTIHQVYLWIGYVGRLFGMSAPLAYHVSRVVFGTLFVFLVYRLFQTLFARADMALLGMLLAFGAANLPNLSFFPFAVDASGRATGRPHYLVADILVVAIVLLLLGKKNSKTTVFLTLFSFLLGLIHPAFGVIVGFFSVSAFPSSAPVLGGLLIGLMLSYWSVHQYPFVSMLAFEGYVVNERIPLTQFFRELLSFGPVLWLAIVGFVWAFVRKPTKGTALMTYWLLATLLLFFFLFPLFRAERVRFIQSLYFVPMAYGAMLFLILLSRCFCRWVVTVGALVILLGSAPVYALALYQTTHTLTDYKEYSTWVFPTIKQMEAYRWLNDRSRTESTVLAGYEAANNILLYSHNFVLGNPQGWTREAGNTMEAERTIFFSGRLSADDARQYLVVHAIDYLYVGYQERTMGDISTYTFLTKVFDNGEVAIYEV